MTPRMLSLVVVTSLLIFAAGCSSHQAVNKAREEGAKTGTEEGQAAGEAAGFEAGVTAGEKTAYRRTLNERYSSGQFHRVPFYTLVMVVSALLLGYGLQYGVTYVLRRVNRLYDIDWFLLPEDLTRTDLAKMLTLLFSLSLFAGCKSEEQKAWKEAFDANQAAAFQAGWSVGEPRGRKIGEERGAALAEEVAATGHAWALYWGLIPLPLVLGFVGGWGVQYVVLTHCAATQRLPQLITVALIPAMTFSKSYRYFEREQQLNLFLNEELNQLEVTKILTYAQMQFVKDTTQKKLKVIASLEESSLERRLDLAKAELAKIIQTQEEKIKHIPTRSLKGVCICPNCKKTVGYPRKKVGETVRCPHRACNRLFKLPSL